MKALVAALVLALAVAVAPAAGAAPAKKKPATVKCHWVKATKKRKRHKVCVKVKAKTKTTKKSAVPAPSTSVPVTSSTAAAPASAAPAPSLPAATDPITAPVVAPAPVAGDPTPPTLTRLQTTSREWSLTLSRPTIPAGALNLQLVNAGEDAHDLHVRPAAGGADLLSAASTQPGTNTTISGTLPAGTYTLYCSLPGHEAAGMHATLTVTP